MSSNKKMNGAAGAGAGFVWFLGFVGALVYYWQHAHSFWAVIVGFFEAFVWPAYLVYHLMTFLRM